MRLNDLKAIPCITVEEHSKRSLSVLADDGYNIHLELTGPVWRFVKNQPPRSAAHLTLRYNIHSIMNP